MNKRKLALGEIKKRSVDLLAVFDEYCIENDLTYWMSYGTLIGAVRHAGFIPWDDDVDLMMPLEDYKRLLHLVNVEGVSLPAPYRIASTSIPYTSSPHHIWFPKVYDTSTCCKWGSDFRKGSDLEMGVWVDIFPIVGADSAQADSSCVAKFEEYQRKAEKCLFETEGKKNALRALPARLMGYRYWNKAYEKLLLQQKNLAGSEFVFDPSYTKVVYRAEWFEETLRLPFEGVKLPAPSQFDEVLSAYYGDWRTLPPEEDRKITHACEFYEV